MSHYFCYITSLFGAQQRINSLPKDKILDWSKLKAFAGDNLYIAQMMIYAFDREENIVGKGEKLVHITSSFSILTVFLKALSS